MSEQTKITKNIKELADEISGQGLELLVNIGDTIHKKLKTLPYNENNRMDEEKIRWRRSADEILKDGYVYDGKSCTDFAVLFIAIAKSKGIETRFAKVKNEKYIHSLVEFKLNNEWYVYDVTNKSLPEKGRLDLDKPWKGWRLLREGEDSWDIGLKKYGDKLKQ